MLPDPEVGKEVLEEDDALDEYDKDGGTSSEDAKMHVSYAMLFVWICTH